MQNKRLLLIVGGLALLTLLVTTVAGTSFFTRVTRTVMPGMDGVDSAPTQMMHGEDSAVGMGSMGAPAMQRVAPDIYPPPYYGDEALNVEDRIYTHSSSLDVVVSNVPEYLSQLRDYIVSVDGRVLSYSVNNYDDTQSGYVRARVPADTFEEARNRATSNVREVVRENVNSQDITGQAVSSEERIANLEQRLSELNAQLAELQEGTSAYVQLQGQITRAEQQLEQAQSAQERVEEDVQYSTIYVNAADNKRYFDPGSRPAPLTEIENAIDSLADTLIGLGYLLIWVVVYAVIWLPVVLVARWLWRRYR